MSAVTVDAARAALSGVAGEAAALDVFGGDADTSALPSTGERRRATRRGRPDPVHRAALFLNPEGVLEWHFTPPQAPTRGVRRRAGGIDEREVPDGDLVDVFEFETLDANSVGAFLERVDARFNPRVTGPSRLWRLSAPAAGGTMPGSSAVTAPIKGTKRRLLIVHGTFSHSQAILDGMGLAPNAPAFFRSVFKTYDEVLAFEHPTLSVSPVLNALDLRQAMATADGPLDIVAHSRGGLVTRWALEAFGLPGTRIRAVLVGSPLGGTSLASPPRLRSSLGLLSNIGTAIKGAGGLASAYMPFLVAPMALLRVATSVVGVAAKTPIVDATMSMIPGLAAQSRVGNNQELLRLRGMPGASRADYFVVSSDFQPTDAGWKFWEWFRGRRLTNAAADRIFPGKNDLIVDTESMFDVPGGVAGKKDFGSNPDVHHTNYFEQAKTLAFLMDVLKMK
jgi:hypothetical protein